MEQATAAEQQEPLGDNTDDPLDVTTVDVHGDDIDDDDDSDDENEKDEEYDPEEDEYLNKFINKESQVGTSLGGPTGPTWTKRVKICFTCISFYRSPRRLTGLREVQQASRIMLNLMMLIQRNLKNEERSFFFQAGHGYTLGRSTPNWSLMFSIFLQRNPNLN